MTVAVLVLGAFLIGLWLGRGSARDHYHAGVAKGWHAGVSTGWDRGFLSGADTARELHR